MSFWKVIALRVVLVVITGVPLAFLLLWLGLGRNLARIVALVVAVIVGQVAVPFRRAPSTQKQS